MLDDITGIPLYVTSSLIIIDAFHGGSRVVCDPPPKDTDSDYFILYQPQTSPVLKSIEEVLEINGFVLGGSLAIHNEGHSKFQSWKKDDLNIVITQDKDWYDKMKLATKVCKFLNLKEKEHRIKVHEAIVYQMDPLIS